MTKRKHVVMVIEKMLLIFHEVRLSNSFHSSKRLPGGWYPHTGLRADMVLFLLKSIPSWVHPTAPLPHC